MSLKRNVFHIDKWINVCGGFFDHRPFRAPKNAVRENIFSGFLMVENVKKSFLSHTSSTPFCFPPPITKQKIRSFFPDCKVSRNFQCKHRCASKWFNDMDFHGNPWKLMILHGLSWKSMLFTMKFHEGPCTFMANFDWASALSPCLTNNKAMWLIKRDHPSSVLYPYWIRINIWQGFMIIHEWSRNFTTLIRTSFPGCSWFLIAFWQGFHVFWQPKISVTSKTMKNHEIPSAKFNVMSFREFSQKFMKFEGIHPWIPWNFPRSSIRLQVKKVYTSWGTSCPLCVHHIMK